MRVEAPEFPGVFAPLCRQTLAIVSEISPTDREGFGVPTVGADLSLKRRRPTSKGSVCGQKGKAFRLVQGQAWLLRAQTFGEGQVPLVHVT